MADEQESIRSNETPIDADMDLHGDTIELDDDDEKALDEAWAKLAAAKGIKQPE